jgi:hypothetical protein
MIGRGMLAASRECLPPSVPVAREINPMTKTNWEETGVEPDVAVPAAQAPQSARAHRGSRARTTASAVVTASLGAGPGRIFADHV